MRMSDWSSDVCSSDLLKTIIYFEIITTVAIIVGMLLADTVQPGAGIDMQQLTASDISQYQKTTAEVQHGPHSLVSTILNLVPSNVFAAIAHGDILPIIRSEEHTYELQSLMRISYAVFC